ncbi:MAG: fimbrillin family protein [Bacteroidia bacterium]|nr:fimbrillin family protein [Bacteroidia bacterium]
MKNKSFLLLLPAAAAVLLVGCSKTEVATVESAPQEITFQTVETKAASNFATDKKFYSYAYFLQKGSTGWSTNYSSATSYISGSLIVYVTEKTAWKNATTTYYWPKEGELTFFAWTDYTSNPSVTDCTISCEKDNGINTTGYDVTRNKNKDLMVADITADQKQNTTQHDSWAKGVPTIFKHVLSNLVFTVRTDETETGNSYPDGMFKLKSVKLKSVYTKGDYSQGSPTANATPWSNQTSDTELSTYSGSEVSVTKTAQTLTPATYDYYIVLPQTFSDTTPVIEIVYTITTNYTGTAVTETVTVEKALKNIYTAGWENGKKYTLGIILGAEEILWDPDVTDWSAGTSAEINI